MKSAFHLDVSSFYNSISMLKHMLIHTGQTVNPYYPLYYYASSISIHSTQYIQKRCIEVSCCLRTEAGTAPQIRRGRTKSGAGTSQFPTPASSASVSRFAPQHSAGLCSTSSVAAGHGMPMEARPLPCHQAPLQPLSGLNHGQQAQEGI
jgi:hypothetical protein